MSSIDELFQKSGIPSKRKFEPARDPTEIYKSVRSNGGSRHAQVDDDDDIEAGPAPPPDDDEDGDYGPAPPPDGDDEGPEDLGDDEEGRFFGGGITKAEASILDYVEGGAGPDAKKSTDLDASSFDAAWLRKTALNLEKRINRNAELRARYESDPAKFIASEADLDADIKALSILGEHPELYPEFARLGSAASLVGLLAHENTDIAISAIEILGELTDEDVDGASDEHWVALVDALVDADLIGLLVSNLERLNESPADDPDGVDRAGVYHALGIVENLCSLRATQAADALGKHEALIKWLLQRVQKKETNESSGEPVVTQNKQYSAEILAVLAQASPANCRRLASLDAMDVLLQLVATYRRRDPEKGSDEEEYMENLFEALTYLVEATEATSNDADETSDGLPLGKAKFVDAEGVELCLLLLKDGKKSRAPALRLLDHAAGGMLAGDVCRKVVDAGGLKTLFTLFMKGEDSKKHKKKEKEKEKEKKLHASPTAEALLNIMASMLRLLPADSDERVRLLAKFVEKDYDKVGQLAALRAEYAARVAAVDTQMDAEGRGPQYLAELMDEDEKEEIETERLSRQLDAGLFTLQTVDIILAWLVAEDGGARKTIRTLLQPGCDAKFGILRKSLEDRRTELDLTLAEGKAMQEMLTALIEFVDSL
ncbi:hypothetical protein F503_00900 [Ophiostoma piceae UAMH 11346]|uniref:Beta-catenin-like protein 1 N-terminal domain-containing protein n=1 Tax=Ophiostoma piceae (strain UAMH 11346) TaxID=1262450 RepID=S3C5P5_OPHP1|nr:hypothetical protein F503_00900 [Ophiostoma piceae UAMH 11346]